MHLFVVWTAALASAPCQSGWTNVGDAPPSREAFTADVDPAALPRRPEPGFIEDSELRVLLPLITTDLWAGRTRLFIDGWLAQSYAYNPYTPSTKTNGPVGYLDRANEYQANELYLRFGRDLDPTRERWDFGGQVDFVYGTDAEFLQAFGLDQKIVLDHEFYRIAIPQIYASAFLPLGEGTTIRVGKSYAPFGLGTPTAIGGFFPTKTYARLYGEPFTVTGATVSQRFGEGVDVMGGVVRGWDSWIDNNNGLSGIASASWRSCSRWTRVTLSGIGGPEQDEPRQTFQGIFVPAGTNANRWLVSGTLEQRLTEKLQLWTQGDWGYQEEATPAGGATWYGVQQGFAYRINDCVTLGLRGEWFRDADGFRVVPRRRSQPTTFIATPADYFSVAFGAQVHLNMWMTLRPELRYDWQQRDDPLAPRAFDEGRRAQQFLAAVDFVVRF